MLKALVGMCALAGCLVSISVPASAQEVVHALSGTVSAINSASKTITVFEDDGGRAVFQDRTAKEKVSLDKRIAEETTAANSFAKPGAYVIVLYFGEGDDRTVVAVKNLGAGPFTSTSGTVKKFDGHHGVTIVDESGTAHTFQINAQSIGEGTYGAVEGSKFDPQKGDQVRIVSAKVNGTPTALFMTEM